MCHEQLSCTMLRFAIDYTTDNVKNKVFIYLYVFCCLKKLVFNIFQTVFHTDITYRILGVKYQYLALNPIQTKN